MDSEKGVVLTMEEAIAYHLEYNFAVPFPEKYLSAFVPVCIRAIEEVNANRYDTHLDLPDGMYWRSLSTGIRQNWVTSAEVVRIHELFNWIKI